MLLTLTLPLILGATQDQPAWKTFAFKEAGFQAAFPTAPAEEKQKVQTATGQLPVTLFVADEDDDLSCVVSYSDIPREEYQKGTEGRRLDFARDGAVANSRGKLRSEKKIDLGGHPGRELVIEPAGDTLVRLRLFAVERRLYQVMVLGRPAVVVGRDGTFFLDSFKLLK